MPTPAQDPSTFLLFALAILAIVGAIALVAYVVLRAVLTRAPRIASRINLREGFSERDIAGARGVRRSQLQPIRASSHVSTACPGGFSTAPIRLPIVGGIGLDALLGLLPVAGDVTSAVIGAGLIARAVRLGAPRAVVSQMVANLCVDLALGAVPVIGDAADIFFRSNQKKHWQAAAGAPHRRKPPGNST